MRSLDSTNAFVAVGEDRRKNGQDGISCPKLAFYTDDPAAAPWTYLFVCKGKMPDVCKRLQENFPLFIHQSIVYKRKRKGVKNEVRPTISGLVFVQGDGGKVQAVLDRFFWGIRLAKDCSTGKTAIIPDRVMQPFMQISRFHSSRIRFLPHLFAYYAEGNQLIRITSGLLKGMEGYCIRMARDRCLITSVGGMTISIGGIHKESFENADEYVKQRQSQQDPDEPSFRNLLTPLQKEIDASFFNPHTELDVMVLAQKLDLWKEKAEQAVKAADFDQALEIATFVLEEIGSRFASVYYDIRKKQAKNIRDLSGKFNQILTTLSGRADVSETQREMLETCRESLLIRFPFLSIDD